MSARTLHAALRQLAELQGVQRAYVDMAGRRQWASAETLLGVLRALGAPGLCLQDVPAALVEATAQRARRLLPPTHVVWLGSGRGPTLRLPAGRSAARWRIQWQAEDGTLLRQDARASQGRARKVGGVEVMEINLTLPKGWPAGYHQVCCHDGTHAATSHLLHAPRAAYRPPGRQRQWGLFAPLYALHSQGDWGVGSFSDLSTLVAWAGRAGGRFVGTLPLLPAWLDQPCEPSPYSPVTRLGWNEIYLDVECVPELAGCPAALKLLNTPVFQRQRRSLQRRPEVDYRAVMRLKREVLEQLCRSFFSRPSARRQTFEAFLTTHPYVVDYARFRAVTERRGVPWPDWPARLRDGELRPGDGSLAVQRYHCYVQWLAHEQMSQVADQAREQGVALYLDMPLGTHREGFDAWRFQEVFASRASGGAPPDPVFTRGQDWGFAPLHPERSRETGHAYMRAYLQHHLAQAGMLRFDHVMGLHRLYWVPEGLPASAGAYVRYPAEEFYALLTLESHRHQAVIVGENLGTVPPEVDAALSRHRVTGMFVGQYEFRPSRRRPLRRVPREVVASVNTHDMPPFHAWYQGLDLVDRQALGLLSPAQVKQERRMRRLMLSALRKVLPRGGGMAESSSQAGILLRRLLDTLASSEARYLLLNLEDFWLEILPQNVPGTSQERVNWRRRLRLSLEAIREDPGIKAWITRVKDRRRKRGRH